MFISKLTVVNQLTYYKIVELPKLLQKYQKASEYIIRNTCTRFIRFVPTTNHAVRCDKNNMEKNSRDKNYTVLSNNNQPSFI